VARAEPEIDALMKAHPDNAAVHALNGSLQLIKGNLRGARQEYERGLEINPRSLEALTGLVTLDMAERNVKKARALVDARVAAEPKRAEVLVLAARVYMVDSDLASAERTLRQAISADPTSSAAYGLLGQVYLVQRRLDQAKVEFEEIAKRNPKDISSRTILGMIAEVQKNGSEARQRYEQILEINPRAAVAANNLAWMIAEEGRDLDRALQLAQTAAELLPNRPEVQDTIGWIYYRKEMPTLAIRPFQESISKDPGNPTYHYHLALAYAKAGEMAQARQSALTALKIKPDYAEAKQLVDSRQE
jgi:Tfp pilus assembly protein PilF